MLSLAVEGEVWRFDGMVRFTGQLVESASMLRKAIENWESRAATVRYVTSAILEAREVYDEPHWLAWADHWITGRDRSFASAMAAYRVVREVCDRELAGMGNSRRSYSFDGNEGAFGPAETPAETAAWACGLALVMAPMSLNPAAGIRRIEVALRSRLSRVKAAEHEQSQRSSLAGRAVVLARRAAAMLSASESA
jgi:hypothetical protein